MNKMFFLLPLLVDVIVLPPDGHQSTMCQILCQSIWTFRLFAQLIHISTHSKGNIIIPEISNNLLHALCDGVERRQLDCLCEVIRVEGGTVSFDFNRVGESA